MVKQSRFWMLTINTPVASDKSKLQTLVDSGTLKYCKVAHETGESGNEHLQIYLVFSRLVRFTAVKKLFHTAHIEPRFGTHQEAVSYIGNPGKSGSVQWCEELGDDSGVASQGNRTDISKTDALLLRIQEQALQGVSFFALWSNPEFFPVLVRYSRGIKEFYADCVESVRIKYLKRLHSLDDRGEDSQDLEDGCAVIVADSSL